MSDHETDQTLLARAVFAEVESERHAKRVHHLEQVIQAVIVYIASTGAPFTSGKYDKNGEWSFSEMIEAGNPEDAKAIKEAFLLLKAVEPNP